MEQKLRDRFREKRVLMFCGAGISRDYPAGLPDWHQLRDDLIEAVARQHPTSQQFAVMLRSAEMLAQPGKRGMTPEVVASVIQSTTTRFFEALRALDEGQPNSNHLLLAELAAAGPLPIVITTNWDRFLEHSFDQAGVRYNLYRTDEEFSTFPTSFEDGHCHLVKLHGCLSIPETITATVEQEGRGLSEAQIRVCDQLLADFTFLFWGYSGADLKIDLDYLRMVTALDRSPGFAWNLYKSATYEEAPNEHVLALKELYGNRACVSPGLLPSALHGLLKGPPPAPMAPEDLKSWSESKQQRLRFTLNAWADENISDVHACCITGSLLTINGDEEEAVMCFKEMERLGRQSNDRSVIGAALNNLGNIHMSLGDNATAESYYQQSLDFAIDRREAAISLRNLGDVLGRIGRTTDAFQAYDAAENDLRAAEDYGSLAVIDSSRAQLLAQMGRREDAIKLYQQAESQFARMGDKGMLAETLSNRAAVHRQLGELDIAENSLAQAAEISRALGDRQSLGHSLLLLGNVRLARGDNDGARDFFSSSETIATESGFSRLLTNVMQAQANLALLENRDSQALELFQKVLDSAKEAEEFQTVAAVDFCLLTINRRLKRYNIAVSYGAQAAALFERLRDWPTAAAAYKDTSDTYLLDLKDSGKAAYGYRIALTFTRLSGQPGESEILTRLEQCQGGPRPLRMILDAVADRDPIAKQLIERNPVWAKFVSAADLRDELHKQATGAKDKPARALAFWLTLAALSAEVDDRNFLADALNEAGMIGTDNAETLFDQSCIIAKGVRDWRTFMMSAYNLGMLAERRGDREAGIKYLNEAATAAELIHDTSALERIESAKQKIIDDRSAL